PPGYVGFQEGGQLTEQVRRKPYSVILFDEIEKAHPDTFNVLLQIMEDGRLTDSKGRVVDFKNTILILTSNIGARAIEKGGGSLGFSTGNSGSADEDRYNRIRERVLDELKQNFRPEFLNRVSDIIVFHQLKQHEIKEIVDILLVEVVARLKEADIEMHFDESVKEMLAREGYDEKSGARPLRRTISRLIEDPLSEDLLLGKIPTGKPLLLKAREDNSIYYEDHVPAAEEAAAEQKEPVESAS
ncbi:MAG: AAA family ATPase, partial [Candidatus Sericytochromatia bacterium]